MKNLFIGLDFGTDSVRALLADEAGSCIASEVSNYPRWSEGKFCRASAGMFRQHPLDYIESMQCAVKGVLKGINRSAVRGIAVDTTGSTPCAVDKDGAPLALHPAFSNNPNAMFILWKDHTAQAEADQINLTASTWEGIDYRKFEGGIYSCEWFWSKLLHVLKSDSEVREAAYSFVEHCDWITGELTGQTAPEKLKRSRCAAGHKALWHKSWGGLPSGDFLSAIDPLLSGWEKKLYSDTYTADIPVGKLSEKWAEIFGLTTDVIIGGSAFDCHFGAVGCSIHPFELVKVIGTSTCDIITAPDVSKTIRGICGQVDGSVVPGLIGLEAGQSAFGDVYAWFKRVLGFAGEISLPQLEQQAAAITPGSTGVMAIDWFNGRRTPDANTKLTGSILGLNLGTTAPMIYRALAESTVFGAKAIIERFREEGIAVQSVSACGGISRKSPFIMQLCADIFNMPVRVSSCDQTCALGGAMFAAAASGVYPNLRTAMDQMGAGYDKEYFPNKDLISCYERMYQKYRMTGALLEKEIELP